MNGLHGIIFSYEQEPGLRELAERRMPASIPFGGRYRVVDFMLSNLHAAGITDVGVVLHGNYQSLLDHIGNGKTWDMARKYGGLRILPPFADTRAYRSGEFRGKMEALAGVRSYLQGIRQDYVVLSDSDLIINLPLADVFAAHLESGADITAVCTANGGFVDNATYLTLESDGAIGQVWCAPTTPRGHRSLEIYILSKQLLLTLVDECSAQDKYSFRRDVLAGMIGALLAQGLASFDACVLAATLHARAGRLAASELTERCVVAEDLPRYLPLVIREFETLRDRMGEQELGARYSTHG